MTVRNPYVGPQALSENSRIYGRREEINSLRDLLIARRVVLLYSASGAGKTSLIQAGLLPELREKEGFRVYLVKGFRGVQDTKNRYLSALCEVLHGALPNDVREKISPTAPLEECVDFATDGMPNARDLILIFDQFEEIFTLDPFDRELKKEFFHELGQALKERTRWALFSMREEYIAELDDYLHLLPTQLKTRYHLGLLERQQAREAIEGPAAEEGVEFAKAAGDGSVANALIDDLCQVRWQTEVGCTEARQGHLVEPVQLQVVCRRLWEHCFPQAVEPPATISEDDIRQVKVDSALEDFYADKAKAAAVYADVPERDVREWVESKLITPQGLRGQVMWEPKKSGGLINRAIKGLEDAHIVRLEAHGDRRWYELTHDRLIKPVTDNNKAWRRTNLHSLQLKTLEWVSREKSRDFGLSPMECWTAWLWSRSNRKIVRPSEMEFLHHSRDRIALRYILPLVMLAFTGVVAGSYVYDSYKQVAELQQREKRLNEWRHAEHTQFDAARGAIGDALTGALKLVTDYKDLQEAGIAKNLDATIRKALIVVLRHSADLRRVFVSDLLARAVAFHPSSPDLIVAYRGTNGQILISSADGRFIKAFKACAEGAVYSLAFSPKKGSLLAAGCGNGEVSVWVWDSATWNPSGRWQAHEDVVWAVGFNRDGTQVASVSMDKKIKLMQLTPDGRNQTLEPLELQPSPQSKARFSEIWSLAMSPTEDKLVAGDEKGKLWLCDTVAKMECRSTDIQGDPSHAMEDDKTPLAIAFSPDGKQIASGHWSGALWLWNEKLETRKKIAQRPSPIYSAAFIDRDGKPWVAFGSDGLWQASLECDVQEPLRPTITTDAVYALSFHSPTGLLAAGTGSGYVTLLETRDSQQRIARRLPLESESDSIGPCQQRKRRRGAVIDESVAATHLVIARCNQLLLIQVMKNGKKSTPILQTILAEQVRQGAVIRVTASAEKRRAATLGEDGSVKFWTFGGNRLVEDPALTLIQADFKVQGFEEPAQRILLSPDGNWLLCSFEDGRLLRVDLRNGKPEVKTIGTPFSRIRELAFSADGKLFAAGGEFKQQPDNVKKQGVVVWDFSEDGLSLHTNEPMYLTQDYVRELALIIDRRRNPLVVAGSRGTIRVWDARTGGPLQELDVGSQPVVQFSFSPVAAVLAAADSDGKITLWSTGSWEMAELTDRPQMREVVGLFGFDKSGRFLLSGADDLNVWDVDISSLIDKVCDILGAGKDQALEPKAAEACH